MLHSLILFERNDTSLYDYVLVLVLVFLTGCSSGTVSAACVINIPSVSYRKNHESIIQFLMATDAHFTVVRLNIVGRT